MGLIEEVPDLVLLDIGDLFTQGLAARTGLSL